MHAEEGSQAVLNHKVVLIAPPAKESFEKLEMVLLLEAVQSIKRCPVVPGCSHGVDCTALVFLPNHVTDF